MFSSLRRAFSLFRSCGEAVSRSLSCWTTGSMKCECMVQENDNITLLEERGIYLSHSSELVG